MVTYQQHSRFYARHATGKYVLDVFELRNAFLNSGSIVERAREFRAERIARVAAGEVPATLDSDKLVCVHAIPHAALAGAVDIDVRRAASQHDQIYPLYSNSLNRAFNIDGLLTHTMPVGHVNYAYLQLYRNGIIETVNSGMIAAGGLRDVDALPSLTFANAIFLFHEQCRALYATLEIEPPLSLVVSLLNVLGAKLGINSPWPERLGARPFDRTHILLPDLFLPEFSSSI